MFVHTKASPHAGLLCYTQPMTKPKSQQAELKQVANLPETVTAFGREYKIAQFNFGQLAAVMEYAGYIGVLIVQATKLGNKPSTADIISFVTQGIGVASPALIPIVSIATKEPIQWLEEQNDVIGGMRIFAKVVEKNKGFFTPENLSELKGTFASLLPETPDAGTDTSTT